MNLFEVESGYETKMRIVATMIEQGNTLSLADLTVSDICEKAGVSRQTFYRHFDDKYAAVNWYASHLYRDLIRLGHDLPCYDVGLETLKVAVDERQFYEFALRRDEDYNSVINTLSRTLYTSWHATVAEHSALLNGKIDYVLRAWSKTGPMLVADWILDGIVIPLETFGEYYAELVPDLLRTTMDECLRLNQAKQATKNR